MIDFSSYQIKVKEHSGVSFLISLIVEGHTCVPFETRGILDSKKISTWYSTYSRVSSALQCSLDAVFGAGIELEDLKLLRVESSEDRFVR